MLTTVHQILGVPSRSSLIESEGLDVMVLVSERTSVTLKGRHRAYLILWLVPSVICVNI